MNEKRLNQRGGVCVCVCVHYKKQVKEHWYTCMDKLFGCLVVWLFGCLVVWLFGCLVVWLFGCLVVCFSSCLFLFLLSFNSRCCKDT